jgi:inosine-uridine nucleoside N-ribohydrolase
MLRLILDKPTAVRILIDTDIGGDVDDALAVALAIHSPELDIKGISLVYEANEWRKGVLDNMLTVYNRTDIPVAVGAEKPLIGLWNGKKPQNPAENKAAEFIIGLCDEDPGLVIAAIGPLTNIAAAICAAPRIAKGRKICLMGGAFNASQPEWNILCDPEAADIVINSGADIDMIPLDVTEKCRFTREEVDAFAEKGEEGRLLHRMMVKCINDFEKAWGRTYLPILHDPLVISALFGNNLLIFKRVNVIIELRGGHTRGATVMHQNGAAIQAAVDVNPELFKKRLVERICK